VHAPSSSSSFDTGEPYSSDDSVQDPNYLSDSSSSSSWSENASSSENNIGDTVEPVDQTELQKFLSEKRSDMLNELNTVFDALKSDILKITTDKVKQSEGSDEQVSVQSYSQVLQNKTQPAVIIKPKQTDRSAVDTKRDINAKINPIEAQLSISKIKNIKDGGVLVGFSSMEDNARFKKVA
jgi:hypothetical protein